MSSNNNNIPGKCLAKNHVKYGAGIGNIPKIWTIAFLFRRLHKYNYIVKKDSDNNNIPENAAKQHNNDTPITMKKQ